MAETNVSVSELKGLAKPICKLVDAVSSAIGIFYEPTNIRRLAQANADAAIIEARNAADVSVIKAKTESDYAIVEAKSASQIADIEYRTKCRIENKERRRQKNIESVVTKAIEYLPPEVSDQKVDEDWTTSFFENCQDVKNEEMQSLWARLLAGEVTRPGTYSLRTLALIKVLGREEALLFSRFCTFVWMIANQLTPILPPNYTAGDIILTFDEISHLMSLGLVQFGGIQNYAVTFQTRVFPTEISILNPALNDQRIVTPIFYFGRGVLVTLPKGTKNIDVGNALLTNTGKELAPIAGAVAHEQYRLEVIERWRTQGWEIADIQKTN